MTSRRQMQTDAQSIADKIFFIKNRYDQRAKDGMPDNQKQALICIADQREDIDVLLSIVETLKAGLECIAQVPRQVDSPSNRADGTEPYRDTQTAAERARERMIEKMFGTGAGK